MTDLLTAIAELRRAREEWPTGDINGVLRGRTKEAICRAALSGDLMLRADAGLALALMVEQAGEIVRAYCHARTVEGRQLKSPAVFTTHSGQCMCEAVRALAPASALAELQALREDRDAWREGSRVQALALKDAEAENVTLRAKVERLTGALKSNGQYLCERCGKIAWGGDHVCRAALTEGGAS